MAFGLSESPIRAKKLLCNELNQVIRVGGAQISPVHANFIANTGGANAEDVLALIEEAQRRVLSDSGRKLHREVRIVGGTP